MLPLTHSMSGKLIELVSPVTPADYAQHKMVLNDQETMSALQPYFNIKTWTDEQVRVRHEKFHQAQVEGTGMQYSVINKADRRIIGNCGFKNISTEKAEAEFGIILHRDVWGKTHAIEASYLCMNFGFEKLGLQLIYMITDIHNMRVQKVCEKFHIPVSSKTPEGYLRYDIRKEDWERLKVLTTPPRNT